MGFAPGECDFVSKLSSFSPILAICELPVEKETPEEGKEPEEADSTTGAIRLVKVEQVSTKFE